MTERCVDANVAIKWVLTTESEREKALILQQFGATALNGGLVDAKQVNRVVGDQAVAARTPPGWALRRSGSVPNPPASAMAPKAPRSVRAKRRRDCDGMNRQRP